MNWFELIFYSAIIACFAWAAKTEADRPYRLKVCLVASGPEGEDRTTEIWSDQIEQYFEKYEGSHCGTCEKERPCPK